MKKLLPFIIFVFSAKAIAYSPAEGTVNGIFGPFYSSTMFHGSASGATSGFTNGAGLLALGDINDKGALEIGMFHLTKSYFREEGGKWMVEQTKLLHITMGYRRWVSPYWSWSLSFF